MSKQTVIDKINELGGGVLENKTAIEENKTAIEENKENIDQHRDILNEQRYLGPYSINRIDNKYPYDFSTLDWENYAYKFIFTFTNLTPLIFETPWVSSFESMSSNGVQTFWTDSTYVKVKVLVHGDFFSILNDRETADVDIASMEIIKIRKSPYIT